MNINNFSPYKNLVRPIALFVIVQTALVYVLKCSKLKACLKKKFNQTLLKIRLTAVAGDLTLSV